MSKELNSALITPFIPPAAAPGIALRFTRQPIIVDLVPEMLLQAGFG